MDIFDYIQLLGRVVDFMGVVILVTGLIAASIFFVHDMLRHVNSDLAYKLYRKNLGKVILLGLEFLVAGDIIRSVAGTPTFTSVGVLAILVLIRSFLSITFEMEVDGKWPWARK